MSSSWFDIPGTVFETSVFHCLDVNELLRLRRVCRWMKHLSEGYLKRHPRSRDTVSLSVRDHGSSSLKTFLCEDELSTISKPVSRFRFHVKSSNLDHPLLVEFLDKYGNQVKHLKISRMTCPMEDLELKFYSKLPKLKSLSVAHFNESRNKQIVFPETFKNLSKLKLPTVAAVIDVERNSYWKLIEFCKNLNIIGNMPLLSEDPGPSHHMKIMREILAQKEHKKLQFYDMNKHHHDGAFWDKSAFADLCEMTVVHNIKLLNVDSQFLNTFDKALQYKIAPQVLSLRNHWTFRGNRNSLLDVTLPNVEQVEICVSRGYWEEGVTGVPAPETIAQMKRSLSSEKFPGLKKLEILIPEAAGDPKLLSMMWNWLENLEEVKFTNTDNLTDVAFIGSGGEKSFLRLKKLSKLDLGDLSKADGLTDASFSEVFRHMELYEFRLASTTPLTSITSIGIDSLRSGVFMRTIVKFPFHNWSLADMDSESFMKLSREFPNNQEL